jgi:putative FmdB family regulatory protein
VPIYQYECPACQATFEELIRSQGEEAQLKCPQCGERELVRQPSVFAAHAAPERAPARAGGCGQCSPDGGCPYAQ